MKALKYTAALAVALMMSGCVSAANDGGEKLTEEEQAEVQAAFDEAQGALDEAKDTVEDSGASLSDILRTIEKEINEEVGDINWADMLLGDYDPENGKRYRVTRAGDTEDPDSSDGVAIEDEKAFIDGLGTGDWKIITSIAEAEPEAAYIIEQEGAKRLFGGVKYDEIGRLTLYDGNKVEFRALSGVLIGDREDEGDWMTVCYEVPEETAELMRSAGKTETAQ